MLLKFLWWSLLLAPTLSNAMPELNRRASPWRIPVDSTAQSQTSGNVGRKLKKHATNEDALSGQARASATEDGATKNKKRRRRRRTKRDEKAPPIETKGMQGNLKSLLALMVKQILHSAQQVRLLAGALMDTFIIPSDSILAANIQAEGTSIAREAQRRREAATDLQPVVPIGPTLFMTMLETLETLPIGEGNQEQVRIMADKYVKMEIDALSDIVQQVKISSCHDDSKCKLVLVMERNAERKVIIRSILSLRDCEHKIGQGPASYMEEELAEWVDALK
jgi:hypothetical protein